MFTEKAFRDCPFYQLNTKMSTPIPCDTVPLDVTKNSSFQSCIATDTGLAANECFWYLLAVIKTRCLLKQN